VLGLGNPLMADDGAGGEALRILEEQYVVPATVDLVDGGTMGLYLLDRVAGYDRVLVVDSMAVDAPPGTIVRVEGDDVAAVFGAHVSPHQAGFSDLLAALTLLGRAPAELVAIGIVPACLEVRLGVSDVVRENLESLAESLAVQLRSWDYVIRRRAS
jgi:hydrogenase maturation protease